jgi:hypothetical protein
MPACRIRLRRSSPLEISVQISPLARRPWAYLDQVQPSTTRARAGDLLTVSLTGRDHQGEALRQDHRDSRATRLGRPIA